MSVALNSVFCTTVRADRDLHTAIGDGRHGDVIAMLGDGASVNCYVDGMTPAARAISCRQPQIAQTVLRYHPDVHQGRIVYRRPDKAGSTSSSLSVSHVMFHDGSRLSPYGALRRHLLQTSAIDRHTPLLLLAVQEGYVDIVAALMEQGADINSTDDVSNETALHIAVKKGNSDIVRYLLRHEPNVNRIDVNSNGPLHLAVANDNHQITRLLLEAGAVVNIPGHDDLLPLHIACGNGSPRMVELLMNVGAMVNVKDVYNQSPLHYTARQGNLEITQMLLVAHANCNGTDDIGRSTPLSRACERGHEDVVRMLIGQRNVSANDEAGNGLCRQLALQMAAANGHIGVMRTLLECGGSINRRDSSRGETALHTAVAHKQEGATRFLISAGIDPNIADKNGRTALHIACREIGGGRLVAVLLEIDSLNLDVMDVSGDTPLMIAIKYHVCRCDIARTLVSKGCRVTCGRPNQASCLHEAIRHGHRKLAIELTRHGCDVNHVGQSGLRPLALLVQRASDLEDIDNNETAQELIMTLLSAGTKVGNTDDPESTLSRLSLLGNTRLLGLAAMNASNVPQTLGRACICRLRAYMSVLNHGASILESITRLPLPVPLRKQLQLDINSVF